MTSKILRQPQEEGVTVTLSVGARLLDELVAVGALVAAAAQASVGGSRPMREREVLTTIRSGLREGRSPTP